MHSFLIGYVPVSKEDDKEETLIHINLWKDKDTSNVIIDFGIMVTDVKKIKAINIYSPYGVEKVEDVVTLLEKNDELITAVFNNDDYKKSKDLGYIIQPQRREPFVLLSFKDEDIEKKDSHHLTFNTERHNSISISRSYFRIRLILAKTNSSEIIIAHKSKGSRFSDFFTSTEIIDFRLNDIRSCGNEYKDFIKPAHLFRMHSVNYLILRDPSEIIIYHGNAMRNSRYLENEIWKNYGLPNDLIAYHFYRKAERIEKKEAESPESPYDYDYIDHFSELVRFQCQRKRYVITALSIIVFTLLFGCLSGLLGNFLYDLLKGLCK